MSSIRCTCPSYEVWAAWYATFDTHLELNLTDPTGILAAVFWFPLGIGLCLLDRHVQCSRCGAVINDGMCG